MKLAISLAAALAAATLFGTAQADESADKAAEPAYMSSEWLSHDTVLEYQKGFRYMKGFEYDKAFEHYIVAARRGYPLAMRAVGILYADGNGTERDDIEAYKWLMLSGEGIDKHNAQVIAKDMTPDQLAEAERRVAEWTSVAE
ncbi:MAG: hypothetical protein CMM50_02695 [Rhodospirillaceae bacterium]|nr:hypothetical protein [Rhodospirillaceae bacterium]